MGAKLFVLWGFMSYHATPVPCMNKIWLAVGSMQTSFTYEHGERLAGMAELGSPSPTSVTSGLCHALPGGVHVLLSDG